VNDLDRQIFALVTLFLAYDRARAVMRVHDLVPNLIHVACDLLAGVGPAVFVPLEG
jgi:hypothetical protein